MSAVEKHDPSVRSKESVQSKGSDAPSSGSGSEPEITPLPAPMPGLSMELEAVEAEEPSLAPLAKLPGVVARPGATKKLKATHSPSSKASSTKPQAKAQPAAPEKSSKPEAKAKPSQAKKPASASAAPEPLPAKPATTLPPLGPSHVASKTADPEPAVAAPAKGSVRESERSRAWWVIGALGLVALGAGVGALMWQPATGPVAPTTPEQPAARLPTPPRTELTVQPIAPLPSGNGAPTPVVEALPSPPSTASANAERGSTAPPSPTTAGTKAPAKPAGDAALHAARTTSKPATEAVTPPSASKPGTEVRPPATKPTAKPAAKPPSVAAAALSMDPVPQLSPPIIRQHMLVAEKRFPSCVREGFGSNVSIGIVVEASGTVRKADILGGLGQSATGRCISEQLRGMRFPPFTEGGATKFFVWSYQLPQAN